MTDYTQTVVILFATLVLIGVMIDEKFPRRKDVYDFENKRQDLGIWR